MLVVTRRLNEAISLPTLQVQIRVLRFIGQSVRIGVEAPPEIPILRSELHNETTPTAPTLNHQLANTLSRINLAVHLAQKQCQAGQVTAAQATLTSAIAALESLEQPPAPAPVTKKRGYRTLIVEDDANERELLAGLLGMSGCECVTATNGEEALAQLEQGDRPDVVLLDMAMPICDGKETLRRIRANERFSGLKIFSVSSTSPQSLNIPEGSVDGWFPKPLNPRRLWDAIQHTLRSPANAN